MAKLYPYSAHTCSLGNSGGFLDGSSETTNSQFSHSSLAPAIVFIGLVFDSVPHSFQGAMHNRGGHTGPRKKIQLFWAPIQKAPEYVLHLRRQLSSSILSFVRDRSSLGLL